MISDKPSLHTLLKLIQEAVSHVNAHVTVSDCEGLSAEGDCEVKDENSTPVLVERDSLTLFTTRQTSLDRGATLKSLHLDNSPLRIENYRFSNQVHLLGIGTKHAEATVVHDNNSEGSLVQATRFQSGMDFNESQADQENTLDMELLSSSSSTFNLTSHLPIFPKPPDRLECISTDPVTAARSQQDF